MKLHNYIVFYRYVRKYLPIFLSITNNHPFFTLVINREQQMKNTTNNTNNTLKIEIDIEKIEEIVQFILLGQYSLACFMFLQVIGRNPLDYIPYRTYNRLVKDKKAFQEIQQDKTQKSSVVSAMEENKIRKTRFTAKTQIELPKIEHQRKVSGGRRSLRN